jgi:hypothetical protein
MSVERPALFTVRALTSGWRRLGLEQNPNAYEQCDRDNAENYQGNDRHLITLGASRPKRYGACVKWRSLSERECAQLHRERGLNRGVRDFHLTR